MEEVSVDPGFDQYQDSDDLYSKHEIVSIKEDLNKIESQNDPINSNIPNIRLEDISLIKNMLTDPANYQDDYEEILDNQSLSNYEEPDMSLSINGLHLVTRGYLNTYPNKNSNELTLYSSSYKRGQKNVSFPAATPKIIMSPRRSPRRNMASMVKDISNISNEDERDKAIVDKSFVEGLSLSHDNQIQTSYL